MAGLPDRPNFILIITDQERATQHFTPNPNDSLQWEQANLPSLTYFRQNGVSFMNAFCNSIMCTPSRTSIFSGFYPAQTTCTDTLTDGGPFSATENTLDPTIINLALIFRAAGYQTHYRGKWHLSKGANGGFDVSTSDVALFGFEGWQPPDSGQDTDPLNFGGGFTDHDSAYVEQAVKFIETVDSDKPFFLVVSLVNPHDVLAYPKSWEYGYTPDWLEGDIELEYTPSWDEDLKAGDKPYVQQVMGPSLAFGLGPLPTKQEKRNYLNFYANLIKLNDQKIQRVLDAVKGRGLSDSTVYVRIADHGEYGMAHGGLRQKPFNMYEECLRVPMVFASEGFPESMKNKQSDHMATLIDLMPTFLDFTHQPEFKDKLPGKSLYEIIQNPESAPPVRDAYLFTFDDIRAGESTRRDALPGANRLRAVRETRWKLARYFHAEAGYPVEFEMYDLQEDPNELYNLASEKVLRRLRRQGKSAEYIRLVRQERVRLEKKLLEMEQTLLWGYKPITTVDLKNKYRPYFGKSLGSVTLNLDHLKG